MIKAKYTIVLKTLLDDVKTKNSILTDGLGNYPLYQTKSNDINVISALPTREQLNTKLLNHYKYREIGFDTIGRFIDELNIAMCEIMPYYNGMLRSVDIINEVDDIFGNVNVEEKTVEKATGTTENESNDESTAKISGTAHNKNVHSETPNNQLSITAKNIDNVDYADNVNWDKNESESDSETTSKNKSKVNADSNREVIYTKKGNQGVNTYAHDIIEFRQTILNVEQDIINDPRIKELFMQVY